MTKESAGSKTLAEFFAPYRKAVHLRLQYQKGGPFAPEPMPWKESVIKPLMAALKCYLGLPIAFSGPFGLKTRFYLHVFGKGAVELVWMGPDLGIGRTDYSKYLNEYPVGSIGYWNGMNYRDKPLSERLTVAKLAALLLREAK